MSSSSSMIVRLPPAISAGFGKYRLIAKLGQGGMAEVFLAAHRGPLGFEKLVVIKRLRSGIATEPEVNAMFLDEARLAARLNHPNVVQTYECGQADEQYYIVMEYLEGQSLDRISKQIEPFRHRAAYLSILSDALAGLHYAHDLLDFDGTPLQVVHRDISPHNLFVTYDGQSKVVDFGIAKWATRDSNTSTGVVKGKIRYMAPEQALATAVDRRADIFAMGVIFWELVVGERFWGELSDVQILRRMTFGELPAIRERWPGAPEEIERICSRSLSMASEGRYDTAAQMRDDIEAYLSTLSTHERRPSAAEIGRLVAEAFAHRRGEVKAAISEQLGRLHHDTVEDAGPLDMFPVLEDGGAWSQTQLHSQTQTRISAHALTVQPASFLPDSAFRAEEASGDSLSMRKTIATLELDRWRPPKRVVWGGAAAVVLLVTGIIGVRALFDSSPPQAMPFSVEASARASTEPGRLIELRILATPPDAKIFLDDLAVQQNPFLAKFERDGTGHRVRVVADGYATEARFVVFTRDETLTFNLHPVGEQVGPAATPAPVVSARPQASGRRPAPGVPGRARSKLHLDTELP